MLRDVITEIGTWRVSHFEKSERGSIRRILFNLMENERYDKKLPHVITVEWRSIFRNCERSRSATRSRIQEQGTKALLIKVTSTVSKVIKNHLWIMCTTFDLLKIFLKILLKKIKTTENVALQNFASEFENPGVSHWLLNDCYHFQRNGHLSVW